MIVNPFMAALALIVAFLAGGVIVFIWTNSGIAKSGKVEHTVLALVYASSLIIFLAGMLNARTALWALPVAVMMMGSGTAWANWRAGVKFWLVFGLMAFLGGLSLLITQIWIPNPSPRVLLAFNAPWVILMLWLVGMVVQRIWAQGTARRH